MAERWEKCPVCGSRLRVCETDEGTQSFEPVDAEKQETLIRSLVELLKELAYAPPVFDDERIRWVNIQVPKRLLREVWDLLEALDKGGDDGKKGNPALIHPELAKIALERAKKKGDFKVVWSEYIRAHWQATGKLAPGCNVEDFLAWYEQEGRKIWGV